MQRSKLDICQKDFWIRVYMIPEKIAKITDVIFYVSTSGVENYPGSNYNYNSTRISLNHTATITPEPYTKSPMNFRYLNFTTKYKSTDGNSLIRFHQNITLLPRKNKEEGR
ncbi:hypothetical protein PFISCL1PPCAC_25270, partial [Pristionchus fissidentatus]